MLQDKVAVIYGAGSIGTAVAKAFAAAGATVYLGGRTQAKLDSVAAGIRADGGDVHTGVVDALDPVSVREHADRVAAEAGHIDICFNLIGHGDVFGTPLIDMDVEDFARPIETAVRSTFLTSQATARHMVRQGSGVILLFGGEGDPMRDYCLGGDLGRLRRHGDHPATAGVRARFEGRGRDHHRDRWHRRDRRRRGQRPGHRGRDRRRDDDRQGGHL